MPTRPRLRDGIPEPWASGGAKTATACSWAFRSPVSPSACATSRLKRVPDGLTPSEIGRYDNEEQHPVRIAEELLAGGHAVYAGAVASGDGENPSHIKDSKRPVETVSWHDCQVFLQQLNERVPGRRLACRVNPVEYACRAGTRPATWAGDLGFQQVSAVLEPLRGTGTTVMGRRSPYEARQRTLGACTTCLAMCGNGAGTCTVPTHVPTHPTVRR